MYGVSRAPKEEHQGYMPGEDGPFKCSLCTYYAHAGACNNRIVIGWARDGKFGLSMAGSLAKVDPNGCSDEFEPTVWSD